MDTWLNPQIVETLSTGPYAQDRRSTHTVNLTGVPVPIGRYPEDGGIPIGAIAPADISRRISRVQATIDLLDGVYVVKDGNGSLSQTGVFFEGKKVDGELQIEPGISGVVLFQYENYKCTLNWPRKEATANGDESAFETLGARNIYLQGELEDKENQLNQLTSDTLQLQQEVVYLKRQIEKDRSAEERQNQRIAKLHTHQQQLTRMWRIIGSILAVILAIMFGFDTDAITKLIHGIAIVLTALGVLKTGLPGQD